MTIKKLLTVMAITIVALSMTFGTALASDFKVAIMQDKPGAAKMFKPLLNYLNSKGIHAQFVTARNYPVAAKMFSEGKVDAMFSGSGIAGSMIIKELAYPVVRPLSTSETSTYWAVVLAPEGAKSYDGTSSYFKSKRVIFCSLASSGEFFYRSINGSTDVGATLLKAPSHGSAIDALSKGKADVAIVKNRVWDKQKAKYSNLALVGQDMGQNPNGTLIASKLSNTATIDKVKAILLGLKADSSAEATAVKNSLSIKGYISTNTNDFKHTLSLLKSAGVNKDFNFSF